MWSVLIDRGLKWIWRCCSPAYASQWRLRRDRPANLFQPYAVTSFDRYPRIFGFVRDRLPTGQPLRLMSFGCSTGEEVFTLRRYFPHATIIGLDINPYNIAICQKRQADDRMHFHVAASPDAWADESFDAVFAMAVFRHGHLRALKPQRCDHLIRFADFQTVVGTLGRCLKPGGLLALHHSNFRFSDTDCCADFQTVLRGTQHSRGPFYGRDDRRLPDADYRDLVFAKSTAAKVVNGV